MGKIRILSDQICNHIAAGEVVERPAAVLKELIENSIDAKASMITVTFKGGGQKLIEVIDNGEGMDREDALLCIERHSTSKISSIRDLESIVSMGFRGEALASISAVSRMKITTKNETSDVGTEIYVEGGKIKYVKDVGCNKGCQIKVSNLFYNVPARKKFLKTEATEKNHLIDCFLRLAMAFPDIHFKMNHADKTLYNFPPTHDLKKRIFQIFGKHVTEKLRLFNHEENDLSIRGYIGSPEIARPTAKQMYIFVNKRPVKDGLLNKVIKDACHGLLTDGYYPFVVVFLDLDPSSVDINVHPTKREVRFKNTKKVTYLLQRAIQEAISGTNKRNHETTIAKAFSKTDNLNKSPQSNREICLREEQIPLSSALKGEKNQKGFFSSLSVLCQVAQTYIVCKDNDGIVIIDFHAAHERILYNQLKEKGLPIPSQNLLTPITFTIFQEDMEEIENHKKTLLKYGYDVDILDQHTGVIRTVPATLKYVDHVAIIQDLLKIISSSRKESDIINSFISSLACHRALRAGKNLSHPEILWLLEEMDKQNLIHTCPHGRPVWIKLTETDLGKLFGRS